MPGNVSLYLVQYNSTNVPKQKEIVDPRFSLEKTYDLVGLPKQNSSNLKTSSPNYAWGNAYAGNISSNTSTNKTLSDYVNTLLGRAYGWGAKGTTGKIDCSGLAKLALASIGKNIPHGSIALYEQSKLKFTDLNLVQPGDLVFLKGTNKSKGKNAISHVMIALGNGEYAEASSSKGVIRHKIDFSKGYYKDHFAGIGRYGIGGKYSVRYRATDVPTQTKIINPTIKTVSSADIPMSSKKTTLTTNSKKNYNWGADMLGTTYTSNTLVDMTKDAENKKQLTLSESPLVGSKAFELAYNELEKTNSNAASRRLFFTKLAKMESGYNSKVINKIGATGYFLFMPETIKWIAGVDLNTFANDSNLLLNSAMKLYDLFLAGFSLKDKLRAKDLGYSDSALVAGAWLGGNGGVKAFLWKNQNRGDGGTTVKKRMDEFNNL